MLQNSLCFNIRTKACQTPPDIPVREESAFQCAIGEAKEGLFSWILTLNPKEIIMSWTPNKTSCNSLNILYIKLHNHHGL